MYYAVKENQIVSIDRNEEIVINELAMMYDKESGTLLKHGEASDVQSYYDDYHKRLKDIYPDMANAAVVVVLNEIDPKMAVNAVNKAMATSGITHLIVKELMR